MDRLIFVCSPYAGDIEGNTRRAIEYCRQVAARGDVPFAPHLHYPQIFDEADPIGRAKGIEMGLRILGNCDELQVFGSVVSEGMRKEINHASRLSKPITFVGEARK